MKKFEDSLADDSRPNPMTAIDIIDEAIIAADIIPDSASKEPPPLPASAIDVGDKTIAIEKSIDAADGEIKGEIYSIRAISDAKSSINTDITGAEPFEDDKCQAIDENAGPTIRIPPLIAD